MEILKVQCFHCLNNVSRDVATCIDFADGTHYLCGNCLKDKRS